MKDTTAQGDIAEWQVAAALVRKGMKLLRPISAASRYDFVIDHDDGRFTRVQCKTGRLKNGCILVRLYSVSGHNTRSKPYRGDVDAFGVYCPETHESYLLPREAIPACGRNATLRVDPSRNGQQKRTRQASNFVIS